MTKPLFISNKNRYGQYFTPSLVAHYMVWLSSVSKNASILEPSSGKGVFLEALSLKGYHNITAYEIDKNVCRNPNVIHASFVTANINQKFDLIIGNPPYIRWKNLEDELKEELRSHPLWSRYFNSLCDYSFIFILKSIELLKEGGELIFITPEYWLNTKHSLGLRNYMVNHGYFEQIIHFNETPIFEQATVSTIIFKFIKSKKNSNKPIRLTQYYAKTPLKSEILDNFHTQTPQANTTYLEIEPFKENQRWLLASKKTQKELEVFENYCFTSKPIATSLFEMDTKKFHTIGDVCDIGNGMVSGLDKAFQLKSIEHLNAHEKAHTLEVIKAKDLQRYSYQNITHYIFLNNIQNEDRLQNDFPNFYQHLEPFKAQLWQRYNYNRDIPYWEWVFLRNFTLFSRDDERIFVPCKERISNKDSFRFALVPSRLYPTQDVTALFVKPHTQESIYYILALLNNHRVFNWLRYNGVIKGSIVEFSQKPIASIPFRAIDWENEDEVELHNEIVELSKKAIKDKKYIQTLNTKIDKLFE